MTLWPDFQEAFAHTERRGRWHRRVMGRRLRPFCAYHALWLEIAGSPLWRTAGSTTRKPSLADLDLASKICACGYGEAPAVIRRPGKLEAWGFAFRALFGSGQFDRWADYMDDYLSPPHRTAKVQGADPHDPLGKHGIMKVNEVHGKNYADLPGALLLVAGLMHLGHVPAREAWMMPWSEAEWLLSALRLQAGGEIDVSNEHDREFLQGLKAGPWKGQ